DLESVADAEDGLARSHEGDEVLRELGPQSRGEDRARPHVISRREAARDHEEVVIVGVPTEFRWHVPGELLQVDPLGLRAEMPEERDGLVLAIRPLDEGDAEPDRRALGVTNSSPSARIGSIRVVFRAAPASPPRAISAAATAKPPSLRSWQAATVPAPIAARR